MRQSLGAKAWWLVGTLCMLPGTAAAHVKWFVSEQGGPLTEVGYYSPAEPVVRMWAVIILVCLAVALLLDRYLPAPPGALTRLALRHRRQIRYLFQLLVGLALLLTAIRGSILAPHLTESGVIGLALRLGEGAAGILLMVNLAVPLAATLLLLLFLLSAGLFGFVASLEYFNFLGIALFLLLATVSADRPAARFKPYALPLLRIHTGIALAVLAWTEKLIDPTLAGC